MGLNYFNARWYDADTGRFITEDPARDGLNWFSYASNNPMKFIDTFSGSIKDNTRIDVRRTRGHTSGHFKSTLEVNVRDSAGNTVNLCTVAAQSYADKAKSSAANDVDFTPQAGTYEGRLYGKSGSYDNPIGLINEELGVTASTNHLIHAQETTNLDPEDPGYAQWNNTGSGLGCLIEKGHGDSHDILTDILESAGYKFGSDDSYYDYDDVIEVNIHDPDNITTTRDGNEIDTHNDPDSKDYDDMGRRK